MATPLGPGPLVYAHRGARTHAPDNTIQAFNLAIAHGADGIELDVQYTRDWHLVVFHDEYHPTAGLLAAIDASTLRAADPTIPTLAEALDAIGDRCFINVEIKNSAWAPSFDRRRALGRLVPDAIDRAGAAERVVVSSFDAPMVAAVRRHQPGMLTAQLLTDTDPRDAIAWAAGAGHDAVNVPRTWLVDDAATVIATAGEWGLAVGVWTVNDPAEITRFTRAGAALVITDDPAAAKAALSE